MYVRRAACAGRTKNRMRPGSGQPESIFVPAPDVQPARLCVIRRRACSPHRSADSPASDCLYGIETFSQVRGLLPYRPRRGLPIPASQGRQDFVVLPDDDFAFADAEHHHVLDRLQRFDHGEHDELRHRVGSNSIDRRSLCRSSHHGWPAIVVELRYDLPGRPIGMARCSLVRIVLILALKHDLRTILTCSRTTPRVIHSSAAPQQSLQGHS